MHRVSRTRRTLGVLATIPILALVAGCAGASTPVEPDEPIDLTMTVWTANEAHLAMLNTIGDAFVEANPDLVSSVTVETIPADSYTTGLTTRIAGGDSPDLAWLFESSALEFVDSGALYPLTETFENTEGYDLADVSTDALKLWTSDGQIYAYPFSSAPQAIYVNSDLLAAAGQPSPADLVASGDWTWDKVAEIATATTKATGKVGFDFSSFNYANWQYLGGLWKGYGAAPWSADGTECTFDSPEMVEAMTWVHDGAFADGFLVAPGNTTDFPSGQVALSAGGPSMANSFDDSFAWDIVPMPEGPAGDSNVIGQAGIGVLESGQNPAVAAQFLAFLTDPENSKAIAAYFPPARTSLLDAAVLAEANPRLTEDQIQAVIVEGGKNAVTLPSHAQFATLQQQVRTSLDALWTPDADVEAVLSATCDAIQPTLSK